MPTIAPPEPVFVTVVDYDITLASGRDFQFTLRPDLGDVEETNDFGLTLKFARTNHHVGIFHQHVAISSRRERQMQLPPEKLKPTATASV